MLSYPHHKNFMEIEKNSFVSPFSWIHKYEILDQMYYTWNIFVPKMFKIVLILMENHQENTYMYLMDQISIVTNMMQVPIKIASSSFQFLLCIWVTL